MKDTETVMNLLDELEQILNHAEASQENVVSGRNLRWEEINFMQLARDGKRCIHGLEQLLDECTFPLEDTRKVTERMNAIGGEFEQFGKEIYAKAVEEWNRQMARKDKAAQRQIPDSVLGLAYVGGKGLLPFWNGWLLGAEVLGMLWNQYQKNDEKKADTKAKAVKERYLQFKKTTKGFCDSFQSFLGLRDRMHSRLQQLEEEARQAEEKKRSNGGRTKSCWYAGIWAGSSEGVVGRRLREIYGLTIDDLHGVKDGKQNPNNVWAALFFCAARRMGIAAAGTEPNNSDYERCLKHADIKVSKNSIRKYHTYCRLFHLGGEPDAGQLHSVSQWIALLREAGDTGEVQRLVEESHRSLTEEAKAFLDAEAKGITIDKKWWQDASHDYPLYSRVFERIEGEAQILSKKRWRISKCRINS